MNALEILSLLDNGNLVSRWDCLRLKNELRDLLKEKKWEHLELQVEHEIESAKESL